MSDAAVVPHAPASPHALSLASAPGRAADGRGPAPRERRVAKAREAAQCERLEQLPNVGPAMAADLRSLGIAHPRELAARDGLALYRQLCRASGRRHDPCVLDTFLAITDFMRGAPAAPWWAYTAERKRRHGDV